MYWLEGKNGKNIPFECLSFDRNEERFNNKEKDWVREYYPDLKCGWSYAMQCIDGGEVKVINLKKKLFEAILTAAEDLGDPTDPETGWDVKFKRVKTGPLVYNVEYQLQVLKCKQRALDENEMALIAELKSMDDVMPRPTPDAQKKFLDEIREETANVDEALAQSLLCHDFVYGRLASKARSKECAQETGHLIATDYFSSKFIVSKVSVKCTLSVVIFLTVCRAWKNWNSTSRLFGK